MSVPWCYAALLMVAFLNAKASGQSEPQPPETTTLPPQPPQPPDIHGDDTTDDGFIEPLSNADLDKFVFNGLEYLFVKKAYKYRHARWLCMNDLNGQLANIRQPGLPEFLAAALAETPNPLDSLWTGGVRLANNDTKQLEWFWTDRLGNPLDHISTAQVDSFVNNTEVKDEQRACLTFARRDHDMPQYQPITCEARRSYICQRAEGGGHADNSTHPGWIKLGTRYYKIFAEEIEYKDAHIKCFQQDQDAYPAVVINYDHSQKLGRYLLIGRPSLENAWIGAKWKNTEYTFEEEGKSLENTTNATTLYPPWRNNTMTRPRGCLLLDRHISNITLFIEARCKRKRPYICYKKELNVSTSWQDIVIGSNGYRMFYEPMKTWTEARDFCRDTYKDYNSTLVEVVTKEHVYNLLYAMGENRTAVQHIWIGGKYNKSTTQHMWQWDSTGNQIDTAILGWVTNTSYTKEVDDSYICLNMDRENHLTAMHYGTRCDYVQNFVCYFTADNLRRLQEFERNATSRADGEIVT